MRLQRQQGRRGLNAEDRPCGYRRGRVGVRLWFGEVYRRAGPSHDSRLSFKATRSQEDKDGRSQVPRMKGDADYWDLLRSPRNSSMHCRAQPVRTKQHWELLECLCSEIHFGSNAIRTTGLSLQNFHQSTHQVLVQIAHPERSRMTFIYSTCPEIYTTKR